MKQAEVFCLCFVERKYMKITEMAKILGVSTKVLRNYEEKGIFSPLRDELNYRNYSLSDFFYAIHSMRFNRLGIPIGKLHDSFETPEKFIKNIDEAYLKSKENFTYDFLNMQFLSNYKKEISTAVNNLGCQWFELSEEEIYLPYSKLNLLEEGMIIGNDVFSTWLKYVQYMRLEMVFHQKEEGYHCLTIPKEYIKYFEDNSIDCGNVIKSQKYFVTIVKATKEKDILDKFNKFLMTLKERNMPINYEEFFRIKLYLIIEEEECYYKLMIPMR